MRKNAAKKCAYYFYFDVYFVKFFKYFFLTQKLAWLSFFATAASCVKLIVKGHLLLQLFYVKMRVIVCVRIALSALRASDYLFTHL